MNIVFGRPGFARVDRGYSVGVVGSGHIATHYHLPILKHLDATNIEFVADIELATVELAARVYETSGHLIEDVSALPDCDVVLFAQPVAERAPYVRELGERGTAIFSEKPFALDREEHERYLGMAEVVTCNYTRMEYGSSEQMAFVFDERIFGDIERIDVCRGTPQKATGKAEAQTDPNFRGGLLHEHGTHLLSQLLWPLKGYELCVEEAEVTWNRGVDIDVSAKLVATNGNECIPVSFDFSLVRHLGREIRFEFENASARYDPSIPEARVEVESKSNGRGRTEAFELYEIAPRNHHQAVVARWIEFLASIESGDIDVEFQTGSQITNVITDIYDTVGRWPEGAK